MSVDGFFGFYTPTVLNGILLGPSFSSRQIFISKFDFSNTLIISFAISLPLMCSHLTNSKNSSAFLFVYKSNAESKLFNFMSFIFITKFSEKFDFFDFVYQVSLQNIIIIDVNNFILNFILNFISFTKLPISYFEDSEQSKTLKPNNQLL